MSQVAGPDAVDLAIRPITPADDPAIATIIREVMTELGASGPGFAIHDPEVGAMSQAYAGAGHTYYVVVDRAGQVVGGAGYAPLAGADPGTCELRKMYFLPRARGLGMGRRTLTHVLAGARAAGYRRCYLETLESMSAARRLYRAFGFERIAAPLGATGHFSCDAWYILPL